MELKNLILLIIAGINLIFGFIVFFKNYKDSANLWFAMIMAGASLWSVGLAISREYAGTEIAINWSRSTYLTALFIGLSFLNFSYSFPYKEKLNNLLNVFIFGPFLILAFILVYKTNFIIKEMTVMPWGYDNIYGLGYSIFMIIFLYYFIWSFINLWKRYKKSDGIIKKQLLVIIIGLGLASFFGMIFDLILPYFGNWKLNWFGPYFTIFVLLAIYYLIFYKKKIQF